MALLVVLAPCSAAAQSSALAVELYPVLSGINFVHYWVNEGIRSTASST